MKKILMGCLAAAVVMPAAFAGSIDALSNQSAKYLMTVSRAASTDASADIVAYNPAGSSLLEKGLYADVSGQTLFKNYEQKYNINFAASAAAPLSSGDKTSKQDKMTAILPNFYALYNFGETGPGKLAAYLQGGVNAGGGELKWDKGTSATQLFITNVFGGPVTSQDLTISSVYKNVGGGVSYSVANMVSASVGAKYVMADRSLEIHGAGYNAGSQAVSIGGKYTYSATGYTPVIGIDVKPISDLTIAAKYEFETDLKFKYKKDSVYGSGNKIVSASPYVAYPVTTVAEALLNYTKISDGSKVNYNLPAILTFGAEYKITPDLAVMASANVYFLSQADLGKVYSSSDGSYVCKLNKYFNNGYETSIGATYNIMKELKVGAGFLYTVCGAKDSYYNNTNTLLNCAANPPLDSYTTGIGATYSFSFGVDLTLAGSYTHYIPKSYNISTTSTATGPFTIKGKYEKNILNIAYGIGYKL